ncbi:MAG: hypothetical protein A2005_01040 [Desulfuromonadales bacterium GWC2_61_20]|nr:MAG: hypothetical protein A2005_01040 [Desulfuromonadales bacterium GWC2_61_20]HAD03138.1 ABC transporter [Desulfuromonas sp.]
MTNNYRVVLEFTGDDLGDYDRVVALETKLEAELQSGEVDGHDVGEGVVNVFIDTRDPQEYFREAMKIMNDMEQTPSAAGYRKLDEEEYERLWPVGDSTPFKVK